MRRSTKVSGEVTIMDVAREAGVSHATVSRVINNKEHVRSDKYERVMQAMTRLGYVVNQQARSLAGGKSQVIGLLVADVGNPYMGEIVRGIENRLISSQYDLLLYTTHRRKTKESTYVSTLAKGLADGLLLVSPQNPHAYLEALRQRHFPYVFIDDLVRDDPGSTVRVTNWQGAYDATRYLLELGHRRIALLAGPEGTATADERYEGYRAALADHGIEFERELVVEGGFAQRRSYAGATTLLALSQPPTAIFALNDVSAFGAMEAVRDHGLRIPDDISILGFDDIPQASHVTPPLTTVRQPLEQMGYMATHILLDYLEHPDRPAEHLELPTTLIIRESCCPPAASKNT